MAAGTDSRHTSIAIPEPSEAHMAAQVPPSPDSPTPSNSLEDPLHPFGHKHYSQRAPWLRAAVLGANDGLTSVASILIGVGAVKSDVKAMLISGLAALIAGALSMAAGEYVSVSSQKDTEKADLRAEIAEHSKGPEYVYKEKLELAQIYEDRGLSKALAWQVAEELSATDPIRAHARDELGIDMDDLSKPWQACFTSALAFAAGAAIPLLSAAFISVYHIRVIVLIVASTLGFITIGALGAWLGGAPLFRASLRVTLGGWFAMAVTFGILYGFGQALGEKTHQTL